MFETAQATDEWDFFAKMGTGGREGAETAAGGRGRFKPLKGVSRGPRLVRELMLQGGRERSDDSHRPVCQKGRHLSYPRNSTFATEVRRACP